MMDVTRVLEEILCEEINNSINRSIIEMVIVHVKELEEIIKLKEDRLRMIKIIKEELKRR